MRLPRLEVDAQTQRLQDVTFLSSPHCDARPVTMEIDTIVIHAIALPPETFGGSYIDDLFLGQLDCDAHPYFKDLRDVRVSAHLCIRRDGHITQYVPFDQRAWHAGESWFDGRTRVNDFSIGVELEGSDTQPFEEIQYRRLVEAGAALMRAHPAIELSRVIGHADIAPARKTDPGPHFDWPRFLTLLEHAR
ncbi:MAG: 1,6-anhydro-N-acetylmuramyl-L-alanine amidase AmpD [Gammaproteobacteria bacterium]|nr:1,6-anhydro-N-acetylmuramyl-L-alanine amidase AmpD [Gammaproteobacteria bacterium]